MDIVVVMVRGCATYLKKRQCNRICLGKSVENVQLFFVVVLWLLRILLSLVSQAVLNGP
jgi:hypothetical protein